MKPKAKIKESAMGTLFFVCGAISVVCVLVLTVYLSVGYIGRGADWSSRRSFDGNLPFENGASPDGGCFADGRTAFGGHPQCRIRPGGYDNFGAGHDAVVQFEQRHMPFGRHFGACRNDFAHGGVGERNRS